MENAILFGIYAVCVKIEIRNNMNDAERKKKRTTAKQTNNHFKNTYSRCVVFICAGVGVMKMRAKKRNFMVNGVVNTSENLVLLSTFVR